MLRDACAVGCDTAVAPAGPFLTCPSRLRVARAARVVYVVRIASPSRAVCESRSEPAVGAPSRAVCELCSEPAVGALFRVVYESRSEPAVGAPARTAHLSLYVEPIFCCAVPIAFTVFAECTAPRKYCGGPVCAEAWCHIGAACSRVARSDTACSVSADRVALVQSCCSLARISSRSVACNGRSSRVQNSARCRVHSTRYSCKSATRHVRSTYSSRSAIRLVRSTCRADRSAPSSKYSTRDASRRKVC